MCGTSSNQLMWLIHRVKSSKLITSSSQMVVCLCTEHKLMNSLHCHSQEPMMTSSPKLCEWHRLMNRFRCHRLMGTWRYFPLMRKHKVWVASVSSELMTVVSVLHDVLSRTKYLLCRMTLNYQDDSMLKPHLVFTSYMSNHQKMTLNVRTLATSKMNHQQITCLPCETFCFNSITCQVVWVSSLCLTSLRAECLMSLDMWLKVSSPQKVLVKMET